MIGAVLQVDGLCCVGVVLITYGTDAGRARVVTWLRVLASSSFGDVAVWRPEIYLISLFSPGAQQQL
jgi:hypothetical protein